MCELPGVGLTRGLRIVQRDVLRSRRHGVYRGDYLRAQALKDSVDAGDFVVDALLHGIGHGIQRLGLRGVPCREVPVVGLYGDEVGLCGGVVAVCVVGLLGRGAELRGIDLPYGGDMHDSRGLVLHVGPHLREDGFLRGIYMGLVPQRRDRVGNDRRDEGIVGVDVALLVGRDGGREAVE